MPLDFGRDSRVEEALRNDATDGVKIYLVRCGLDNSYDYARGSWVLTVSQRAIATRNSKRSNFVVTGFGFALSDLQNNSAYRYILISRDWGAAIYA